MKNKITRWSGFLFVLIFTGAFGSALAQDNSSKNPANIGTPVRSMIELGSVNSNIYDITVTTLEVVRGADAQARMKAIATNPAAPAGYEYLLARVKFELKSRAVSNRMGLDLGDSPLQWVALSSNLTEYEKPAKLTAPAPALVGTLTPGKSMEGWVALAVATSEAKPVMVFDPDTGGAGGRGQTLFFKLYK